MPQPLTPSSLSKILAAGSIGILLLTGCGTNSEENTAQSPTSSTTTNADDSATANEKEGKDSPSPSSSTSAEKFSGGSKAPVGEYRPADEHGPAQNVPKPEKPEGIDVETPEAMEKFIYYWNDLKNYAIQTGNTQEIRKLVSSDFTTEVNNYNSWEEAYYSDGWVVGGNSELILNPNLTKSLGDGKYNIAVNYNNADAVIILDKNFVSHKLSEENKKWFVLKVLFADDNKWYVIDESEVI